MQPEDYLSFLVRLWHDHPGVHQLDGWHGELELIQTGARWSFCTRAELFAFLQWLMIAPKADTHPVSGTPIED